MLKKKNKDSEKIKTFQLTKLEIALIEKEKKKYEYPQAAAIEALKIVQEQRGWICKQSISAISKMIDITEVDLEGISTFYSQIFLKPVGKNIIWYCDSIVCFINGYKEIKKKLESELNIKKGETTEDKKFTLLPICCLGNCDKSPTIMINKKIYDNVTVESIPLILKSYK